MPEPSVYKHLPAAYTRDPSSDLWKLLDALDSPLDKAKASVADFRDDMALTRGDKIGLDWAGENFGIARPPGMLDTLYRAVVLAMAGMRRGTVAAIKQLLDTATGLTWTVEDNQLNGTVPAGEVWCSVSSGVSPSYATAAYANITANYDNDPRESAIAGTILDSEGIAGGAYNDHAWAPVDVWIQALVDKVKAAGIKVVYK